LQSADRSVTAGNLRNEGEHNVDRLLQLLPVGATSPHVGAVLGCPLRRETSSHAEWESVSQQDSGIYVVCLDCGRHFAYDWSRMRVVK